MPIQSGDPRGIWADGETMWVVDDYKGYVYVMHYRDFRHHTDEIGISEVHIPRGLWTDGETMWVINAVRDVAILGTERRRLQAFSLSDGSREAVSDIIWYEINEEPLAAWGNGTTVWVSDGDVDTLYAYSMVEGQRGLIETDRYITLVTANGDPEGTWSDGTTMWVADSEDDTLYAYNLETGNRQSNKEINLAPGNEDPRNIWSDGRTIWVLDSADKHVYAYNLGSGSRKTAREFRPVPENDDLGGGLTGHGLRFWVHDSTGQKLYSYGKPNTPPTFSQSSASFKIHYTHGGASYVGTVPEATDTDGDSLTYFLTGTDAASFTLDSQTREIYTKSGATNFVGGDQFELTVTVTDGKGGPDGLDFRVDASIGATLTSPTMQMPISIRRTVRCLKFGKISQQTRASLKLTSLTRIMIPWPTPGLSAPRVLSILTQASLNSGLMRNSTTRPQARTT